MNASVNPTQRFSDRVEDYVKYRPSYPPSVIELLKNEAGLSVSATVADIGSGTGIFTALLLPHARRVYAIEPNREMRMAAEQQLGGTEGFVSRSGTAERTDLPEQSVDLITVAQAFHWFEPASARTELQRILRPDGKLALIWNDRKTETSPFLIAYEDLIRRFSRDYKSVNHRNVVNDGSVARFFAPGVPQRRSFENAQEFDFDGLKGRLLSSSYAPKGGDPQNEPMLVELHRLFDRFQNAGRVKIEYSTDVFWGELK